MSINNISVGDKIVAKKSTYIADEGKIGNVTDVIDKFISFTFDGNPKVNYTMDFDTFNNYFEKLKDEKIEIPRITKDYIADIMANSEFETHTAFNKCTVVSCRLPNGFVITESSACVNLEDYDVELGEEICIDKIAERIWELEAYRLQQWMWEEGMVNIPTEDCPHGCDDCVNCPCDGEGCE